MFKKKSCIPVFFTLLLTQPAWAVKFSNQFVEFELPPQWNCSLEGAEWVCQSTVTSKKKEAIIVLAAKLKGIQDSLDQYLTYLSASKNFTSVQGKQVKSEKKFAKTQNINGQAWVDSLHLESELPGFFTRYLATVKQDIGVLVTYSVKRNKYQDYIEVFDPMVKTLKVFRKAGGINVGPQQASLFQTPPQIPTDLSSDTTFSNQLVQPAAEQAPVEQKKRSGIPLPLILGGGALALFFLLRRKK